MTQTNNLSNTTTSNKQVNLGTTGTTATSKDLYPDLFRLEQNQVSTKEAAPAAENDVMKDPLTTSIRMAENAVDCYPSLVKELENTGTDMQRESLHALENKTGGSCGTCGTVGVSEPIDGSSLSADNDITSALMEKQKNVQMALSEAKVDLYPREVRNLENSNDSVIVEALHHVEKEEVGICSGCGHHAME